MQLWVISVFSPLVPGPISMFADVTREYRVRFPVSQPEGGPGRHLRPLLSAAGQPCSSRISLGSLPERRLVISRRVAVSKSVRLTSSVIIAAQRTLSGPWVHLN
eukprot:scaffold7761_cov417-Prasinococcus_capsulatus_cf.AAC.3